MNSNWYFHHITEDIIYDQIQSDGRWLKLMRELKKNAIIRKLARDTSYDVDGLPDVLAIEVKSYRNKNYGEMRNENMGSV